ncbi:hypothetical protein [Acidianus sp. HS-5]|uniref:hypothetical protein n=1 Tax=Acidianus sp. HS-5 TaxID=2886040 RepID=UPI001F2E2547|nr:hypothetical protein [Acidianus sp. HS-5]BDC17144.1 hypothetical protein HS5_00340 [Acidianus sp. HS-5]
MDEIEKLRLIIGILEEKMPEDCAEILDEKFKILLKEIKNNGIDKVIKRYYSDDEIEVIQT